MNRRRRLLLDSKDRLIQDGDKVKLITDFEGANKGTTGTAILYHPTDDHGDVTLPHYNHPYRFLVVLDPPWDGIIGYVSYEDLPEEIRHRTYRFDSRYVVIISPLSDETYNEDDTLFE